MMKGILGDLIRSASWKNSNMISKSKMKKMAKIKLLGRTNWMFKANVIFVFVFLNIWDFVTSREIFNAMVLGLFMFTIPAILWLSRDFKIVMLNTLISIMEFVTLLVFVMQSFEIGGAMNGASKSLFWMPYLLLAGFNAFWGLRIYSKNKKRVEKRLKIV